MNNTLESLKGHLLEIECEAEELEECADLEDRMAIQLKLARARELYAKAIHGVPVKWLDCGLCHGQGFYTDYEDRYECSACDGDGGKWREA